MKLMSTISFRSFIALFVTMMAALFLASCGGGGGAPGLPSGTATALSTSAPSALSLVRGTTQSYTILGGRAPYVATSSNVSIAQATIIGNGFDLMATAPGAVTVDVRDAAGKVVSITVTVTDGSSSTPLFTTAPSALSLVAGTSQTYSVSGGLAPYTANSSNGAVAVAGINGGQISIAALMVGTSTVSVVDAVGKTVSISVTVGNGSSATALYTTAPTGGVVISNGGARSFQIGGGLAPYRATSIDSTVVGATVSGSNLSLAGLSGGSTTVEIRDSAGGVVIVNVRVGSSTNFFTTAPSALTVSVGSASSYVVSGGSQVYVANSGNAAVATASVSGSVLTILGVTTGNTSVILSDLSGSTIPIAVTVVANANTLVAKIDVSTSTNTLQSAGSEATITALVKNSGNVGVAGQAVVFSASSGSLQSPTAVTDASGAATVRLSAGSDKSVRDIRVTVSAGLVSGNVVVPVTGTRLSIAGSGTLQAGASASQYTVRALDSSSNPVIGVPLTVRSSLGNALSSASLATDTTGSATFMYTPSGAGADTLTVEGLGTSANASVVVTAVSFVVLSPASNASIAIGSSQPISVRYQLSGMGVAGQVVSFSTSRGTFDATPANITTDSSGQATIRLSSTTAGSAVVVAQISGIGSVSIPVQFVATQPTTVAIQSNPGAVLPNVTGTNNKSSIEAVVRDVNGNPVANRQVNFTILQDLSSGTLSTGNTMTDANGRAQVDFIPGATSTPANGVVIQAEVASTSPAVRQTTSLTVNGNALFITLGFGNDITNLDPTTYSKSFSVYVTDANGVAVGNQLVTLSAIPTDYQKGTLSRGVTTWEFSAGSPTATCANEDRNSDGILNAGEDTNGDTKLSPGNIAAVAPGSVTTDSAGRAVFALQYGEQYAPWATVRITARALVSGTESRQSVLFGLRGLISDFTLDVTPAGAISPFGMSSSCTDSN